MSDDLKYADLRVHVEGAPTIPNAPGEPDAMTFSIDFPYSFVTRRRPKGWALIWLRTRYFLPDLWWEIKVLYWKATGEWERM